MKLLTKNNKEDAIFVTAMRIMYALLFIQSKASKERHLLSGSELIFCITMEMKDTDKMSCIIKSLSVTKIRLSLSPSQVL